MRVDQKTKNVYWKALRLFYYSVLCEIAQLNVGALMMLQGVVAANFVERWEAFVMHVGSKEITQGRRSSLFLNDN